MRKFAAIICAALAALAGLLALGAVVIARRRSAT